MKNSSYKKWARLLLFVMLALTLGFSLLPSSVFADCDPHPLDECGLWVNINLPASGTQVAVGSTFWVNASVTRPYDAGTIDGVTATLVIDTGDAVIADCDATQGPEQLNNCSESVDFWWKLACTGTADVTFHVEAASTTASPCGPNYAGVSAPRTVVQIDPVCPACLEIEIIECGPEDIQGTPMPARPSNVYGVKALIHNVCTETICGVVSTISWKGDAEPVPLDYPLSLDVGCIYPGRSEEVGWTFKCTGGEDAVFTVSAVCTAPCTPFGGFIDPCGPPVIPDPCAGVCLAQSATCVVDQICPAAIGVTIDPLPEKICTDCSNTFNVVAHVCETCGETGLTDVTATITVTGPADVAGPLTTTVCPSLGAGACADKTWVVTCTGPGDVTVTVSVEGWDAYNGEKRTATTATYTVEQKDMLTVNVLTPLDYERFNVCENFEVTYRVTNCTINDINTTVFAGIDLSGAANVALAAMTATVTPGACAGAPAYVVPLTDVGDGVYTLPIDCICACCYVDVTIQLQCVGSGVTDCDLENILDEVIEVFAGMEPQGDYADDDTVIVHQMYKAHLVASLDAWEGVIGSSLDTLEGCEQVCAVVPGESFTVVAVIANQGETTAEDVTVSLGWTGNVVLGDTPATQVISSIGCHGAAKVMWQFTCVGEGEAVFFLTGISGIDANTEVAIHEDNIETACQIKIQQVPLNVIIIQPVTCTDFLENESFTIKASITNMSNSYTLDDVMVELRWPTEDEGCHPCGDFLLQTPKVIDITPATDTLLPGESAQVTWQVQCCKAGDVSFWIDVKAVTVASAGKPSCSLDIVSATNTIHQWQRGGIVCSILSPKLNDYDYCFEYGEPEAMIATGQFFSVTAMLLNTGNLPFSVNAIDLWAEGWGYMGDIEVLSTNFGDLSMNPILLAPYSEAGNSVVVSFDVVCSEPGLTDIIIMSSGVSVPPDGSAGVAGSCFSVVTVMQYSAANLVVQITEAPAEPVAVGDEYTVTATITNVGDADAWDATATISVYPAASATISVNDQFGSYSRALGNIDGHGLNESVEVSWLMRSVAEGDVTLTVNAVGYDESGYEVKQICTSEIYDGFQISCCDLVLHGTPGAAIPARFIKAASVTVAQGEGGSGGEEPPTGNYDMTLYPGWNLVSSPWYVAPEDRAPEIFLWEAIPGVQTVYAFNAATGTWSTYSPPGIGGLAEMRDGPGYWILMDTTDPIVVEVLDGAPAGAGWTPPTYTIDTLGWNLIGPRIGEDDDMTAAQWLNTLNVALIYGYDAEGGFYFVVGPNDLVQPGMGYWVAFTQTGPRYK